VDDVFIGILCYFIGILCYFIGILCYFFGDKTLIHNTKTLSLFFILQIKKKRNNIAGLDDREYSFFFLADADSQSDPTGKTKPIFFYFSAM